MGLDAPLADRLAVGVYRRRRLRPVRVGWALCARRWRVEHHRGRELHLAVRGAAGLLGYRRVEPELPRQAVLHLCLEHRAEPCTAHVERRRADAADRKVRLVALRQERARLHLVPKCARMERHTYCSHVHVHVHVHAHVACACT